MMTERVKDCAPGDDGGEVDTAACASTSLPSARRTPSPCIKHTRDTSSRILLLLASSCTA